MTKRIFILTVAVVTISVAAPASGTVRISEICAASSDRLLRWSDDNRARLGTGASWYEAEFDAQYWSFAPGPMGFGTSGIATDLSVEMENTPSLYLRHVFSVSAGEAASSQDVMLDVDYDDGFVAYLNGTEVLRKNAGGTGAFMYHDQTAFNAHPSGSIESYTLGRASALLQAGDNILAVQAHNKSGAFFISASLRTSGGTSLATSAGPWHYLVGNYEPSGGLVDHSVFEAAPQLPLNAWTLAGFDDSTWATGPGGIGFGDGDDNTDVEALVKNICVSVYMRRSFLVDAATANSTTPLTFTVDYDDGYVAWLNGNEILRSANMGSPGDFVPYNTTMSTGNEVGTPTTHTLSAANTLLVEGENVLSIQVHNKSLTSTDMSMIADLDLGTTPLVHYADLWTYFIGTEEPVQPPDAVAVDDDLSDFVDWIELENTGPSSVSLHGWSLTDNPENPDQWTFPDVTLAPNERKVILCTGRDLTNAAAPYLHTDFKLSAGGEYVGLYSPDETLVSEIAPAFPPQDWRYTYGWDATSASYRYLADATPGQTNSATTYLALPRPPEASHESGVYDSPITVTLSMVAPATDIYYTRDGRTPNPTVGTRYTNRLSFSSAGVLRAASVTADGVVSDPVTHNYLVNIPDAFTNVPIICLTGDWDTSINMPHGVTAVHGGQWVDRNWVANGPDDYNIPIIRGRAYERRIHMNVLYADAQNTTNYQANCGIRIAGSNHSRPKFKGENTRSERESMDGPWTDGPFNNKPQLNLFFRGAYGTDRFEFPLFGDPDTRLKSLRLRGGKNDWKSPFIRDELARRLFTRMGQISCTGNIAAVFVNGEYRNYYNPVPRYDENFFQEAHDSSRDFDVIPRSGVSEGDRLAYDEMVGFATTHDLTDPDNYRQLERRLDIENFIDYLIIECYAANYDWPNNNWVVARERSALGRLRYYLWDTEISFNRNAAVVNSFTGEGHQANPGKFLNSGSDDIPRLYRALRDSETFRIHWYDRAWKHFAPDGALNPVNALVTHDELMSELEPLLHYTFGSTPSTQARNYVSARKDPFIQQLRDENLWFDVDPPVFSVPGGTTTNGAQIAVTHNTVGGTIYYNFDGDDPRGHGGVIAGTQYVAPITIDRSRHIKARVLKDGVWGALAEETYLTLHPKLLISEIMYNPADPPGGSPYENDDFEFVELYNADTTAIPLPPVFIDNGIAFNFSGGGVNRIAPGEYIVLVRNPEAFATRYDTNTIIVAGTYTDKLSNGSDTLELMHADYGTLVKGRYQDDWYKHTDGDGYSLNLRNLAAPGVFEENTSWKPSSVYGGTPGKADPDSVPEPGAVVVNELLSHTDLSPVGDWIELHNTTDEPIDLGGWTLSDDRTYLVKYVIPANTILPAQGYVQLNAANHFDSPAALTPFAFSEYGDEAVLTSPVDTHGFVTGYRDDVDFDGSEREYTFGRHIRSDGKADWTTLSTGTPGAANAYPSVGPIVFHEICYQPATNAVEFIQLYNITDVDQPLFDTLTPTNTWHISGGIDFAFPLNTWLPAHRALILCGGDPAVFRATHSIPANIQVLGPFQNVLDNQGETIKLYRPGITDPEGTPWILAERVTYNDKAPWPIVTNGMSSAIQRVSNITYGNEPTNWMLGAPNSPPRPTAQADSDLDGLPDRWEAHYGLAFGQPGDDADDTDSDRMDNYSEYVAGTNPGDSNSVFRLDVQATNGAAVIFFDSIQASGSVGYEGLRRTYSLAYSPALAPLEHHPLPGATNLRATGSRLTVTNSIPLDRLFIHGSVRLIPGDG